MALCRLWLRSDAGLGPAELQQPPASSTAGRPGLQDLGSFVYFQTCTVPETNLPANLLLIKMKSNTESSSADPKPNPILKALRGREGLEDPLNVTAAFSGAGWFIWYPWAGALQPCRLCLMLLHMPQGW